MSPGRVVVVGSVGQDVVLQVRSLPVPGETVLGTPAELGFGGKGANQAVAAAAAGADVVFVGRVGDDAVGVAYRERLRAFGVDVTQLRLSAGRPTGTAYILVDSHGDNSIVVVPGANGAMTEADLDGLADLGPGDVLLVQCEVPTVVVAEAVRRADGVGARVVLNLAPYDDGLPAQVVARADPLVVNETEADKVAARPGRGLEAYVPASLLVTRGPDGAGWGDLSRPALEVAPNEVLDTTGAGDAFCGALAAALAAGRDRADALDAALTAGADAVRRVGAQPAEPPRSHV